LRQIYGKLVCRKSVQRFKKGSKFSIYAERKQNHQFASEVHYPGSIKEHTTAESTLRAELSHVGKTW